ncbi:hypothetical protein F5883DRAFT_634513 [Diaporthe sp. PMI_573]|nr:hypothetical protein F5883DRAFT_634513 [Diaporthaceae sp. PMI_573]
MYSIQVNALLPGRAIGQEVAEEGEYSALADKTVIVTGSNTGLGLEAARHFVRLGAAQVVLAVWQLDMSNYDSIKAFATRCSLLDRLDVVVANAGVLKNTYEDSNGTEITIKVNVIATFFLAISLLPILRKSRSKTGQTPRLVITGSVVHEMAKFRERYQPSIFEALTKTRTAAMQNGPHSAEPVVLNNVNPGLCHSELTKDVKLTIYIQGVKSLAASFAKALMARTTEVGGRTLEPSAFVRSKEGARAQERVHKELIGILETIQPGIANNI